MSGTTDAEDVVLRVLKQQLGGYTSEERSTSPQPQRQPMAGQHHQGVFASLGGPATTPSVTSSEAEPDSPSLPRRVDDSHPAARLPAWSPPPSLFRDSGGYDSPFTMPNVQPDLGINSAWTAGNSTIQNHLLELGATPASLAAATEPSGTQQPSANVSMTAAQQAAAGFGYITAQQPGFGTSHIDGDVFTAASMAAAVPGSVLPPSDLFPFQPSLTQPMDLASTVSEWNAPSPSVDGGSIQRASQVVTAHSAPCAAAHSAPLFQNTGLQHVASAGIASSFPNHLAQPATGTQSLLFGGNARVQSNVTNHGNSLPSTAHPNAFHPLDVSDLSASVADQREHAAQSAVPTQSGQCTFVSEFLQRELHKEPTSTQQTLNHGPRLSESAELPLQHALQKTSLSSLNSDSEFSLALQQATPMHTALQHPAPVHPAGVAIAGGQGAAAAALSSHQSSPLGHASLTELLNQSMAGSSSSQSMADQAGSSTLAYTLPSASSRPTGNMIPGLSALSPGLGNAPLQSLFPGQQLATSDPLQGFPDFAHLLPGHGNEQHPFTGTLEPSIPFDLRSQASAISSSTSATEDETNYTVGQLMAIAGAVAGGEADNELSDLDRRLPLNAATAAAAAAIAAAAADPGYASGSSLDAPAAFPQNMEPENEVQVNLRRISQDRNAKAEDVRKCLDVEFIPNEGLLGTFFDMEVRARCVVIPWAEHMKDGCQLRAVWREVGETTRIEERVGTVCSSGDAGPHVLTFRSITIDQTNKITQPLKYIIILQCDCNCFLVRLPGVFIWKRRPRQRNRRKPDDNSDGRRPPPRQRRHGAEYVPSRHQHRLVLGKRKSGGGSAASNSAACPYSMGYKVAIGYTPSACSPPPSLVSSQQHSHGNMPGVTTLT